jgi:hypothetical protein
MFFQLMPLHWGQVSRTVNVSGADPASSAIGPTEGEGGTRPRKGRAKIKLIAGSGGTKSLKGSGGK